jgi:acyl dehydratase
MLLTIIGILSSILVLIIVGYTIPERRHVRFDAKGGCTLPAWVMPLAYFKGAFSDIKRVLFWLPTLDSKPNISMTLVNVSVDHTIIGGLRRIRTQSGVPNEPVSDSDADSDADIDSDLALIPLTYWNVFSFRMLISLLTHNLFPLPLLGGVHVRSLIRQHRSMPRNNAVYDVQMRVADVQPHKRGTEVDFLCEVRMHGSRHVYWDVTTTILCFHARSKAERKMLAAQAAGNEFTASAGDVECFRVPLQLQHNLGRQYAPLTGDINPIHMSAMCARMLGFKRTVVHGMCLVEQALPSMLRAMDTRPSFGGGSSPRDFQHMIKEEDQPSIDEDKRVQSREGVICGKSELSVQFRRPVFLPSRVHLTATRQQCDIQHETDRICFDIDGGTNSDRVCVTGHVALQVI